MGTDRGETSVGFLEFRKRVQESVGNVVEESVRSRVVVVRGGSGIRRGGRRRLGLMFVFEDILGAAVRGCKLTREGMD